MPTLQMPALLKDRGSVSTGTSVVRQPGELIADRYSLIDLVGVGRTSVKLEDEAASGQHWITFRARDRVFEADTTLRLRKMSTEGLAAVSSRLASVVERLSALNHPNVDVPVDVGVDDDIVFVVSAVISGFPLRTLLSLRKRTGRHFDPESLYLLIKPLFEGVHAIHQQTVHGRLSLDNIVVSSDGLKVTELILGELIPPEKHEADADFAAPELLAGETPTPRSDVYSLGRVVKALIANAGFEVPQPDVADALRDVLARATDPKPVERFGTVEEFGNALLRAIKGEDVETLDVEEDDGTHRTRRKTDPGMPGAKKGQSMSAEDATGLAALIAGAVEEETARRGSADDSAGSSRVKPLPKPEEVDDIEDNWAEALSGLHGSDETDSTSEEGDASADKGADTPDSAEDGDELDGLEPVDDAFVLEASDIYGGVEAPEKTTLPPTGAPAIKPASGVFSRRLESGARIMTPKELQARRRAGEKHRDSDEGQPGAEESSKPPPKKKTPKKKTLISMPARERAPLSDEKRKRPKPLGVASARSGTADNIELDKQSADEPRSSKKTRESSKEPGAEKDDTKGKAGRKRSPTPGARSGRALRQAVEERRSARDSGRGGVLGVSARQLGTQSQEESDAEEEGIDVLGPTAPLGDAESLEEAARERQAPRDTANADNAEGGEEQTLEDSQQDNLSEDGSEPESEPAAPRFAIEEPPSSQGTSPFVWIVVAAVIAAVVGVLLFAGDKEKDAETSDTTAEGTEAGDDSGAPDDSGDESIDSADGELAARQNNGGNDDDSDDGGPGDGAGSGDAGTNVQPLPATDDTDGTGDSNDNAMADASGSDQNPEDGAEETGDDDDGQEDSEERDSQDGDSDETQDEDSDETQDEDSDDADETATVALECPSGMRLVDDLSEPYCIDRYEFPAKGLKPKVLVTHDAAAAMCKGAGKRLCTTAEWKAACGNGWGYSSSWREGRCNDAAEGGALRPAGENRRCRGKSGAIDMVGNAAEWTEEGDAMGGSFSDSSEEASCSARKSVSGRSEAVGFRCCRAPFESQ